MTYDEVIGIIQYRMKDLKDGYELIAKKTVDEISNSSPNTLDFPNFTIDQLKYHACSYCELEFIYDILTNDTLRKDYLSDLTDSDKDKYGLNNL